MGTRLSLIFVPFYCHDSRFTNNHLKYYFYCARENWIDQCKTALLQGNRVSGNSSGLSLGFVHFHGL